MDGGVFLTAIETPEQFCAVKCWNVDGLIGYFEKFFDGSLEGVMVHLVLFSLGKIVFPLLQVLWRLKGHAVAEEADGDDNDKYHKNKQDKQFHKNSFLWEAAVCQKSFAYDKT